MCRHLYDVVCPIQINTILLNVELYVKKSGRSYNLCCYNLCLFALISLCNAQVVTAAQVIMQWRGCGLLYYRFVSTFMLALDPFKAANNFFTHVPI